MGLLKVYYGGAKLPIKITGLNRNLTPSFNHETNKIGNSNGVMLLSSSYAERAITIEYLINNYSASDLSSFREEMARLIASKKTKQLIFSDEPSRYYDAIITGEQTLSEDYLQSTGTLTFFVPDGLAHSTVTKTFAATKNSNGILEATIINEGTADVPVDYTIKHNHDNGYLGIVSEYGAIQAGKIDEADSEIYKQNELLVSTDKFAEFADDTGGNSEDPNKLTNGKLAIGEANGRNILYLSEAGSGQGIHGGMVSMNVPPDSEGKTGAANFYSYFNTWFETGKANQVASMSINYLDTNNKLIFSYVIEKSNKSSNIAKVIMRVGGNSPKTFSEINFQPTLYDAHNMFNMGRGHVDVVKEGAKLSGYYFGTHKSIIVPELENVACSKIQIYIGQYDTSELVTRAYFRYFSFQKVNVEKWADAPNRYPNGSEVIIDGKEGKIYTDGILRMNDEIKGSQYFMVPPGETKIQFYYSNFSDPPPEITAKIREAWI